MKRIAVFPKSKQEWLELRTKDITSTEVAALFGCSPYITEFELWHQKKDSTIVEIESNERMTWGNRLQDAIASGIAEDNGWSVRRMDEYISLPDVRAGSSFDFSIEEDRCNTCEEKKDRHVDGFECKNFNPIQTGLLEIKNVDGLAFKEGWIHEGDSIEAPPHIELQVQHQLFVSGRDYAYIGALVGGNKVCQIMREPDPEVIGAIREKVSSFWKSIESGNEPKPNFKRDAKFISRLYKYAEPGAVFDARGHDILETLMSHYEDASAAEKKAKTNKEALKAEILTIIGNAEKVLGARYTLSTGMIGPSSYTVNREGYRNFKPSWKKEK